MRSTPSLAESAEEAAVDKAVEALRKALLGRDKARLEDLTAEQLSYGHSDGRVQTKAQFVEDVMTSKAIRRSLAFPELNITVAGDAAIARHLYVSEREIDGKPATIRVGALQVWQRQEGDWKLLALQGYKLA